jgi:SulP family sulfate permease
MSEWRQFKSLLKGNRIDIIILLTTFFLTVIFDLIIAIEVGLVLSSFMFMKRMSESVNIQTITSEGINGENLFDNELMELPKDVLLYEINGPLFFGAARQFQETIMNTNIKPKAIIIRMRYVPLIDATGFQSLKEIIKSYNSRNIAIILSGVSRSLLLELEKNGLFPILGKEFIFEDINQAIKKSNENHSE